MACPRCGAETPEGARFCPSCDLDLSVAGPREERKFVSILFVDMVGSTEQADGTDPEDVRERNQLYYDEVRGRIEMHGATTLGKMLTRQGSDASAELRSAVEIADRLGSPLLRWQSRAALADAPGVDREGLLQEAASLIRGVAASLAPERASGYLSAPQVVEVLEAAG
jgi:class 3 adenylate cyclase